MTGGRRRLAMIVGLVLAMAGCSAATVPDPTMDEAAAVSREGSTTTSGPSSTSTSTTSAPTTSTTVAVPPTTTAAAPAPPPTTPAPVPTARTVHEQQWTPFAQVEALVLHHPSARVELIGFHEANHDGARPLTALATAAPTVVLETRERGTGPTTAADVVSDPDVEVRAPVTGRVLRAGRYVLYCDNYDDFVVIEPDARPGWEVKVLHIDGVQVRAGDRVEAGVTVIAPRPTQLPFESQVDEATARPAWPHVHVEVVDPSIPDRPSPGGGSNC